MKTNYLFFSVLITISVFLFGSCSSGNDSIFSSSKKDFEKAKETGTAKAYDDFISKHEESELAATARDSIIAIIGRIDDLNLVVKELYEIEDHEAASTIKSNIEMMVDSLYSQALKADDYEHWESFLEKVPGEFARDAQGRLNDCKDSINWADESTAWQIALKNNTMKSYERYFAKYPNGKHAKQIQSAYNKLIEGEYGIYAYGKHETWDNMYDKVSNAASSYSVIETENRSDSEMIVNYCGPDSKRIRIPSNETGSIKIGNGKYRIVLYFEDEDVTPVVGDATFNGGKYFSSIYIETKLRYVPQFSK